MLIQLQKLSKSQRMEVVHLSQQCQDADGNTLPIYEHLLEEERVLPSTFLYYEDHHLVGFLSAFFFYENACEVTLIVAPNYRKKGIARRLLEALKPLIEVQDIDTLIFSMRPEADRTRLSNLGFAYQNSEFQMLRDDPTPIAEKSRSLTIRPAHGDDIPQLSLLDALCFPNQPIDMEKRFLIILQDTKFTIFTVEVNGAIIGKAHIQWLENKARLTDIAITPTLQGKGIGTQLMIHCINHALSIGIIDLVLDVETTNQNALKLYTNLGFFSINSCDFWTISKQLFSTLT